MFFQKHIHLLSIQTLSSEYVLNLLLYRVLRREIPFKMELYKFVEMNFFCYLVFIYVYIIYLFILIEIVVQA